MKLVIEATPHELLEMGVRTAEELHSKILKSVTSQGLPAVVEVPPSNEFKKLYEEAMDASNEAGYAGLDAASTIRALAADLKALNAKLGEVGVSRTDAEVVAQTEELAKMLLSWRWGTVPDDPNVQLRHTANPKGQQSWQAACEIQDLLSGTDVHSAVAEVDGDDAADIDPQHGDHGHDPEHDDGHDQAHVADQVAMDEQHQAQATTPVQEDERTQQAAGGATLRVAAGARRVNSVRSVKPVDAPAHQPPAAAQAPQATARPQGQPRALPTEKQAQAQTVQRTNAGADVLATVGRESTGSGFVRRRVGAR